MKTRSAHPAFVTGLGVILSNLILARAQTLPVDFSEYWAESGIAVHAENNLLRVIYPGTSNETIRIDFNLRSNLALIESISIGGNGETPKTILRELDPVTLLTIGERDLKPSGWMAFFDDPMSRPHLTYPVVLNRRGFRVKSTGANTRVSIGDVTAGSFRGEIWCTFYRNSPLMQVETVVKTAEDGRAILYDTGLSSRSPNWRAMAWKEALSPALSDLPSRHLERAGAFAGDLRRANLSPHEAAAPLAVTSRALAAESANGSVVVFPAPHQFFYPVDEVLNAKFVWYGKGYGGQVPDFGFGIRQSPTGINHFIPWFNAPPNTEQHLGVFYLISRGDAAKALEAVSRYTHGDRFPEIPSHLTFTSHYHIEHTQELLRTQRAQKTYQIPESLKVPGFVKTFKAHGVNIVHLGEFHLAVNAPRMATAERLPMLKAMFDECRRLSDDQLLVLPGEEANVHLGGHWMSLFPKPIYWMLNRSDIDPFVEEVAGYGTVYHVGNSGDVLRLMEKENGLMWTAHARIKSSFGFPDKYKDTEFYHSDHFLGAAWKAMPADLSHPRLGRRVLDLFDDMSNWNLKKQVIGEVDAFRMEPEFETYGAMNINYLKLDKLPKYSDGWASVLETLRRGQFFTTTGEILIPKFKVAGHETGETVEASQAQNPTIEATLNWTFPLSFAEVISGDGKNVFRERIDLTDTESFGTRDLKVPVKLNGRNWVRFEVWDIGANGAFTQAVWVK